MAPFPPVVSSCWLRDHLGEVVALDVRWYLDGRSGRQAYLRGHLPGAVWVDLDASLAGPPSPAAGRHPLPDPEIFAAAMSTAGVGDRDRVVAYDDAAGMAAARLVWMLRATGRRAALLDGGIAGWDGPLEAGDVRRAPAEFAVRPWPADRVADAPAAERVTRDGGALLDARSPERYRGETEPIDPRAGHIPGAVNVPFAGNLGDDGRFLPAAALRDRFAAAGVSAATDTVVYCGSGVSACHDLLALELAGWGPGRLYVGSWSQWSADPDRPAATGPDPR